MSSSKSITVFGGTGQQGGSVVHSLLADKWKIRVFARSNSSHAAKDLAAKGVEIIVGDVRNEADVAAAVRGMETVFMNLNFWDRDIWDNEFAIGKMMVDVFKNEGVQQVVYSSLPNAEKISKGALKVVHFSGKAKLAEYILSKGFRYAHFVEPSMYYNAWLTFLPAVKIGDEFVIYVPGTGKNAIPMFDASDYGIGVRLVLSDPERFNGKFLQLEGDTLTPGEAIKILSEVSGKHIQCSFLPYDEYEMRFPDTHEIAEMFHYFDDCGYWGPQVPGLHIRMNEGCKSFRSFLEQTRMYEKFLQ